MKETGHFQYILETLENMWHWKNVEDMEKFIRPGDEQIPYSVARCLRDSTSL